MSKVKLLLYCTKNGRPLVWGSDNPYMDDCYTQTYGYSREEADKIFGMLNGKIVAECDCDKVEEIACCCVPYRNKNNLGYEYFIDNGVYKVEWNKNNIVDYDPLPYKEEGVVFERSDRYIDSMFKNEDLKKMCLSPQELLDYIKLGNDGYALHLSNLKVFDKPYQLDDLFLLGEKGNVHVLEKAPQNMCNVSFRYGALRGTEQIINNYVLISIRPEWLCKILNGEKTIVIRKQIVNELKEMM